MSKLCKQSIVVIIVMTIAGVKTILDMDVVKTLAILLTAILSVLIINCLCDGDKCSGLAWVYAVVISANAIVLSGIVNLEPKKKKKNK